MAQDSERKEISMAQDLERKETFQTLAAFHFQKLICNLLISVHPIVSAKYMHPLNILYAHNYYLNLQTIYLEYKSTLYLDDKFKTITNIYEMMWTAIRTNSLLILKWLIKNNINVNARDGYALRIAACYGNIEIVKLLLSKKINIHSEDDYALRFASKHGFTDVVQLLLEHGANVNACNGYPLCYASSHGHLEIVKLLIAASADININNKYALSRAKHNGHLEIVNLLNQYS